MVSHEAVGMTDPVVMRYDGCKLLEKDLSVSIVKKNFPFLVSSSGDVVEGTWVCDTKWS